jgi:Predicted membrane protein (DUF2207)
MRLGRIGWWRHVLVGAVVVVLGVLALGGCIGGGVRPERFDAKQVTVWPVGGDALRLREVVDIDFGSNDRRGYQRIVPNDFGVPVDVVASSPDAPDDVTVEDMGDGTTRIRIGDPDVYLTGQHRYVLEYTLPAALVSTGVLALDVIGTDESFETGRFEVVVTGMELFAPRCSVGSFGVAGGCELEPAPEGYRTVIEPLEPGDGVTIGGSIQAIGPPTFPDEPPLPERSEDRAVPVAASVLGVGALVGVGTFWRFRRIGRNEVFAGGAADAAMGDLPGPGSTERLGTRLVADDQMDELATIEFVPPAGIAPWQGRVLLTESVDDSTTVAWLSGLVADQMVIIDESGDDPVLRRGPRYGEADPSTTTHLAELFDGRDSIELGTYDSGFATAWSAVGDDLRAHVASSGWWRSLPGVTPGRGCSGPTLLAVLVVLATAVGLWIPPVRSWIWDRVQSWPGAIVLTVVVVGVVAGGAYSFMVASRSATGSALALRTESFRRFLEASEARHVEWAWQQGLLREYSAWAVALDTADAWEDALQRANVPADVRTDVTTPLLVYTAASSISATHTAPSSSGSGGSGGFSGGSVGGGGGGGGSGSW